MKHIGPVISRHGLERLGLGPSRCVRWNLAAPALVQLAVGQDEGCLVADGALSASTGRHTGRAPRDRYIVERAEIAGAIDWGKVNQPLEATAAERLWAKARAHAGDRELYVQDLHAGADPAHRLRVRVITETAWHSLFARNMFRLPPHEELAAFEPDFTVLQLPSLRAEPETDGTRSETAILLDLAARRVLICDTVLRRRDQEIDLHRAELPAARGGGAADALLGQRRRQGRRRGLLRPLGHRQDHALGRPCADPDRRRRAWLGPRRRVQFRGRLLRQGDQPQRRGRARDLRRLDPFRGDSRECGRRPADRRGRFRRRQPDREHPLLLSARLHPQRQRQRHAPTIPSTSSC